MLKLADWVDPKKSSGRKRGLKIFWVTLVERPLNFSAAGLREDRVSQLQSHTKTGLLSHT